MADRLLWGKFYWGDHQGDPLLRMCSFAAQGAWMRLVCIAAASDRFGYVLLNGRRPSPGELAKVIGGTPEEVASLVEELERQGVFSRDRTGAIYVRRMVRDAKKQAASREGGKIGGLTTFRKQKGIFATQGPAQDGTPDLETRDKRLEARDYKNLSRRESLRDHVDLKVDNQAIGAFLAKAEKSLNEGTQLDAETWHRIEMIMVGDSLPEGLSEWARRLIEEPTPGNSAIDGEAL